MLKERKIARSYASALFGLSEEMGIIPLVYQDIQLLEKTLDQNPELKKILASPVIRSQRKNSILQALFGNQTEELTMKFLELLCKSLRVLYLKEVCLQYYVLYRAHMGIRQVKICSATSLEEHTKGQILALLRDQLQADIELSETIDPKLVGGFIIQADDMRFDASIRSKLHKLHKEFDVNVFSKGF